MHDERPPGSPESRSRVPSEREPTSSAALDGFRLLPRRKLPVFPPKGERLSGLLRPATLVWLVIGVVLIVTVVVGVTTSQSGAPTTLAGVTAEATAQADDVIGTLSETPVAIEDGSAVEPCADGSDREQYALVRTLTAAPGFDPAGWAASLREGYEAKGWNVVTRAAGEDGGLSIRMIGLNLVPLEITLAPADDGTTVVLRSISRCAA